jgi:alkyl-hydroperoxide reductase/thiol specific antioxidant family protein
VAELRPHVEELRAIGVEPFVIGSGTPEQAAKFQQHVHAEGLPILSDEALASYRAAELKRSMGATLHPKSWWKGVKSFAKHPQGKTAGDPWQLGGAMIVKRDGDVSWRFASAVGGDHPAIATLLDEARKAVA